MRLVIHDKNGERSRNVSQEYARAYRNRYKDQYLTWIDNNNNTHIDFSHRPQMIKIHERHSQTKEPLIYWLPKPKADSFINANNDYPSLKDEKDYYIDFSQRIKPDLAPA